MEMKKYSDLSLGILKGNGKKALKELILQVAIPLAEEWAKETPNKMDDVVVSVAEGPLKSAVEAL